LHVIIVADADLLKAENWWNGLEGMERAIWSWFAVWKCKAGYRAAQ
jgi:hypothetical protein